MMDNPMWRPPTLVKISLAAVFLLLAGWFPAGPMFLITVNNKKRPG